MKVLISLLLLFFAAQIQSQTITQYAGPTSGPANTFLQISGTGFTGATQVALGTATDGVFVVVNDTTLNYTVPNDAPIGLDTLTIITPTAMISSSPLTFTVTPLVAYTVISPRCIPDQFNSNFHSMVTSGGSTVYTLWCDDQISLATWGVSGFPRMELLAIPLACKTFLGNFSWSLNWLQQAWGSCMVQPLNTDQQLAFHALAFKWTPHLAVTAGTNQNVYTQKADGTKGPQLVVNGIGEQIAPGATCDGDRLQNAGARFAAVVGRVSTDNVTLPPGSFALCTIIYPPAGGFTLN